MRSIVAVIIGLSLSAAAFAQGPNRPRRPSGPSGTVEMAVKQASESLVEMRKVYERDVQVLKHLVAADEALKDPTQPTIAVEKADDEIGEAERLGSSEFAVRQGIIRARQAVEGAKKSPTTADFPRLRSIVSDEAIGPARRVVIRNTAFLQEAIHEWIKAQELITSHLRNLTDIAAEGLRVAQ